MIGARTDDKQYVETVLSSLHKILGKEILGCGYRYK